MFNNSFAKGVKAAYDKSVSVGDELSKVLPPTSSKLTKTFVTKAFRGDRVSVEQTYKGQKFEIFFNPIYDEKSNVIGAAMFIRNITERTKMEESVKALNHELTAQNIQLAAQERDLKSALDELSERNFELDQLVYKTSHDLRSPLSSIMGLINLASIDPDPVAIQEYLGKIEGRVKKLDEFICSMLDYARVNRIDVVPEAIDLKAMAKSCIHELEYLENFQKVSTRITSNKKNATCSLDKLRMKIIFSNIISNAYKYFNPETESYLKLHIEIGKKSIRLTFEDNGIGIKEEHKGKIFNMFYRATDRSQGSGLGMYIVKQAVEKLSGTIHLDSIYGSGTTIQITLPTK
jgi:signal transduction histidine kinase